MSKKRIRYNDGAVWRCLRCRGRVVVPEPHYGPTASPGLVTRYLAKQELVAVCRMCKLTDLIKGEELIRPDGHCCTWTRSACTALPTLLAVHALGGEAATYNMGFQNPSWLTR